MKKLEKKLEDEVAHSVLHNYGIPSIPLKLMYGVNTGWPDRLFLLPNGHVLFIEFKRSTSDKLSPKQLRTIKDVMLLLGHKVEVHHDKITAIKAIRKAYEVATSRVPEESDKIPT